MEIEHKNQSNNNFDDAMDLFEIEYVYANKPINRTFEQPNLKDKYIFYGGDFYLDGKRAEVIVHWSDVSSPKGVKLKKSLIELSDYTIIM